MDVFCVWVVVKWVGVEFILYGYIYIDSFESIEGFNGFVLVVGVLLVISVLGGYKLVVCYNFFFIEKIEFGWICWMDEYGFMLEGGLIV